jgi:hypothetical protein
MNIHQSAYPSLRELEGVIARLESLSDQNGLVRFLHNVDNTKTLTGFVQKLANAITDYQVRVTGPTVIFTEHPARFQCNRECMRGQGKSMTTLRTSMMTPKAFIVIPRTS